MLGHLYRPSQERLWGDQETVWRNLHMAGYCAYPIDPVAWRKRILLFFNRILSAMSHNRHNMIYQN